jgi:phosphoenolpyruvate carboxylase
VRRGNPGVDDSTHCQRTLRDATAVIAKQHRAIAALNQKVSHLQALVDQSPHIAKAVARDPDVLMKTVDLLLAESDATRKEAATRPPRAAKEQVGTADKGRIFTRHSGNVLPALSG